jgi:porphobilinogen synthase
VEEGADMVMVKPGIAYLDIVREKCSKCSGNSISCFWWVCHDQGRCRRGWLDHDSTMMEQLMCIKRAGASLISTYFAKEAAVILNKEKDKYHFIKR